MNVSLASYKRYWEPNFGQMLGLSLFAGTVATAVTHPIEFIKTVIQHRAELIGLRGYKGNFNSIQSGNKDITVGEL